ncbi:MAG: RHS repeat-associated core domain-containing protein, partial [Deltaproteobacteria bacterium]|nr:RHS repeat-associated core domain-containing protein [Nannocystaceae bacterium]
VVATIVMGKDGEGVGDTLAQPTVRMEYDLHAFADRGAPVFVRTLRREQHVSVDPAARILESYAHYDGGGRVVQTKAQAEPGLAPHRDADGVLVLDAEGRPELVHTDTRWVGSGRTVVDNKGNPVKQYEPFFSDRPEFDGEDELGRTGVTPLLHYDAFGRLVRTDFPDGTLARVEIEAWRIATHDRNDTVLESAWFAERTGLGADASERRAAELAAAHANTPTVAHLDSLGRTVLTDEHDVADGVTTHALTRQVLDAEGNVLAVIDARGNTAETRRFAMGGVALLVDSPDAGWRRALTDVAGAPLRGWNARGFATRAGYDDMRRATHAFATAPGQSEMLVARTVWGESLASPEANNLRTRAYRVYDGAGVVTSERFDFAGNLRAQERRLAVAYESTQDWSALEGAMPPTPASIAAIAEADLEIETFEVAMQYDALGRVTSSTTPDGSETRSRYNEAGLLDAVEVRIRGAGVATSIVGDFEYDARGRRQRCVHGNGTVTTYTYGRESLRLERLRLVRASDDAVLQDLRYTYDPVGNIVQIRDGAQPEVYFANDVVSAEQLFEYSALYRLTAASGREHASLGQPTDADFAFGPQPHPDDPAALRRYEERYAWDAVGNILELRHAASGGSFTRQHIYAAGGNRLLSSSAPGESVAPFSHSYPYDAHGNMTAMPHLAAVAWDHADRMQHCDLGGGGDVWFVYDAGGERVRKVQVNASGSTVRERIYLGGYEVYRERAANSTTPTAERQTLHVADDTGRLCLVETLTVDDGENVDAPVSIQRYQHGNHLGSAALELDENASVISYEEFHPFGTTSYAANDAGIEVSAKRYRYIGKERDEETGLYHLGARYYASWLARWTAADPIGLGDGVNRYAYARGNSVTLLDPVGTDAMSPAELAAAKQRLAQINARLAELDELERDAAKLDEGIARQKQQT